MSDLRHTVVTHGQDGTVHVQHYGEPHEIPGSAVIITLLPGESVIVRHLPDPEVISKPETETNQ